MKKHYAMWLLASSLLELSGCQAAVAAGATDVDTIDQPEQELGVATVPVDMDKLESMGDRALPGRVKRCGDPSDADRS